MSSQAAPRTGVPLPHGKLNVHLQRKVMNALCGLDAASVGRLAPVLSLLAEMRRVDDPRQREARRLGIREAWVMLDAGGKPVYSQVRRRSGKTRLAALEAAAAGGPATVGMTHPWEHNAAIRAAFGALREQWKREDISAWRRWAHRWHGWMVEYMTPEQRGGMRAKRRTEDKALTADDPSHEIGQRHDMRQLFEAMTRRQQAAVQRLTRTATGSIPAWLVLAPEKPRGRPRQSS